jgi:hypothetical protein
MRQPSMGRRRRSTTASSVGAGSVCSTDFRGTGSEGRQARSVDDRCDPSEGASDGRQPLKKGGCSQMYWTHQGRSELQAPRRLRWQRAPAHHAAERRADEHYKGAALMIDAFPKAKVLLGDKGYDADWFRAAVAERDITPCIPSKANRKVPIPYDPVLYRQRSKIREHVRQAQGLASYPYPLRSLRPHFHVSHLHRRNRYLLAQLMSPEPRSSGIQDQRWRSRAQPPFVSTHGSWPGRTARWHRRHPAVRTPATCSPGSHRYGCANQARPSRSLTGKLRRSKSATVRSRAPAIFASKTSPSCAASSVE